MKNRDYLFSVVLIILATFIWLRNMHWISSDDDTLPILIALPLFIWLGTPWSWRSDSPPLSSRRIVCAIGCFLLGIITNITLLMALGWTWLLWLWLSSRVNPESLSSVKKLLVLPLMAFPWVTLDAQTVGWWFRLSGASVAAKLFSYGGLTVIHEGTHLSVNGLPISVEAACSGLNTLQSMLIAGSIVAYLQLRETSTYWWNLLWLPLMAWIANTIRIIAICLVGLAISREFAMGPFHDIGGWIIIFLMFCLCWLLFSLQQPKSTKNHE